MWYNTSSTPSSERIRHSEGRCTSATQDWPTMPCEDNRNVFTNTESWVRWGEIRCALRRRRLDLAVSTFHWIWKVKATPLPGFRSAECENLYSLIKKAQLPTSGWWRDRSNPAGQNLTGTDFHTAHLEFAFIHLPHYPHHL